MRDKQKHIDLKDESFHCLEKFPYLGNVICAGGSASDSVVARIRSGRRNFKKLLPLTLRGPSLRSRGQLYVACMECDVECQQNLGSERGPCLQAKPEGDDD